MADEPRVPERAPGEGGSAGVAPEAPQPSLAEALVRGLEAGGRAEAGGRLEVDREQAQAKLAAFQLPDPRVYVLLLVQAAVRQQARAIDLVFEGGGLSMRFDGRPFAAEALAGLEDAILAPEAEDDAERYGLRELAVALNTLAALPIAEVVLRSGTKEGYAELRRGAGGKPTVRTVDLAHWERQAHLAGTFVEVRGSLGAAVLGKAQVGMSAEERLVRERCHAVPAKITIHNELVFGGLKLRDAVAQADLGDGRFDGVAGFLPGASSAPELRVVRDGVWVHSVELDLPTPGFVALVRCDALQVDLSRFGVIRDARWRRLEALLGETWKTCLLRLEPIARRVAAARRPEERWARERLLSALLARRSRDAFDGETAGPFGAALAALKLWSTGATARGTARPVSLAALLREADRGEAIPWILLPPERWEVGWDRPLRGLRTSLCLRLPSVRERAWLEGLLPTALRPLEAVDRDVHAQLERHLAASADRLRAGRAFWLVLVASLLMAAVGLALAAGRGC